MKTYKYIALLRGINVGGNNKVEMKKLKNIFETLGYENVSTYINTGNVVFESGDKDIKKMTSAIEKALENNLGIAIRVVLRDKANIQDLAEKIPKDWRNDAEQRTDVLFLWDEFDDEKSIELIKTNPDVDNLKYMDGAIVWNVNRKHYTKSGMNKFVGTSLYKHMTARNVNTVRKLAELLG